MDNLTHSLAGLLVAEACLVKLDPQATVVGKEQVASTKLSLRLLVCVTSILANNFPDLDFVYSGITYGKLGYLLHHRGHTHTFLLGLVQSALVFLLATKWARWRQLKLSSAERYCLAGVALFGPILHISMDFLNNYGVHPFWPFNNEWVYGDALFIIEPYLMLTLAAFLVWSMKTRVARGAMLALIAALLGACWLTSYVSFLAAQAVTALAFIMLWLSYAWTRRFRVITAAGMALMLVLMFSVGSHLAGKMAHVGMKTALGSEPEEVMVTAHPANPFCYDVIGVGQSARDYVLSFGTVSVLPAIISPRSCSPLRTASSLPMEPLDVEAGGLYLRSVWRKPLSKLQEQFGSICLAREFLRFARAPFLIESSTASAIGDFRYDVESGSGFAEIPLPQGGKDCPKFVPPWVPPRAKLLLP